MSSCPRCRLELGAELELGTEIAGPLSLLRCRRCAGIWLDPAAFRALCETDAGEGAAAALARARAETGGAAREERVRYLRCPLCEEVMDRVNFARVSGVVLDVCRAHGAWFDAGELHQIRRFVRSGGLARFARRKILDRELGRARAPDRRATSYWSSSIDFLCVLVDVLAGIPDPWDVPRRRTARSQLLRSLVLAIAGGALLWTALPRLTVEPGSTFFASAAVTGALLLVAACRALRDALGRWHERP